jgi:hypothetical protein
MPIKLRVVGILYNNIVNLSGGSTVQQVLDAAVANPGPQASGFGYIPTGPQGRTSVQAFKVRYPKPIKSVTSGRMYPAGIYFLQESSAPQGPQNVWQYYIYDSEGRVVGPNNNVHVDPTNPGGGTINYFGSASAIVPDGGSLVWRLVAIPTGPNDPTPIAMSRMIHTQMSDETS